eukprot:CAMPEP_0114246888 /NCGR_PEP_ID=MMETSP0058-20121206/12718_1 /TAXON_ID=36894 /ORGANISM="Pyramimonas parkeae, CCMP726" /LENGTH=414 /DNA_ID=CAMNT_0001360135 /DNA_START=49 /DNA_END=1295 /DNA_ORIENTATION=-
MAAIACTSGRVTISCKSPKNYSPASNARASPSMAARAMSARVALPTKLSRSTVSTRATRAVQVRAETAKTEVKGETYEVTLQKPLQVKFARGQDGGAYVIQVVPGAVGYEDFEEGDKIVRVSASFGTDIWTAENYGQVMYAVKTRSGDIFFELEKRGGDVSVFERAAGDKKSGAQRERAGGNYGAGTQELQMKNYASKKELAEQRVVMFNEALDLYKQKKYDEALVIFENVVGLEPKGYIGDDQSKITEIYRVSQYNVACCYSMIKQEDAGLDALKQCLMSGYDDYKTIRSDPGLEFLRGSEDFKPLLDKFDEPLINENAMKVLNKLFGKKNKLAARVDLLREGGKSGKPHSTLHDSMGSENDFAAEEYEEDQETFSCAGTIICLQPGQVPNIDRFASCQALLGIIHEPLPVTV